MRQASHTDAVGDGNDVKLMVEMIVLEPGVGNDYDGGDRGW